mgnify:FL=1
MKKFVNYTIRILLSFLMLIPYFVEPFSVMAATNNSKATTIAGLRKELEALKQQKADKQSEKKQAQNQINQNKQAVEDARAEQQQIANDVVDAEEKIKKSNEDIAKAKEDVDVVLKYYQLSNNQNEYLEYITGASSPTDLIMRVEAVSQLSSYYKNKIDDLDKLIKENEQLKIDLANKNTELDDKIANTSKAISKLNNQLDEINDINEDIDSQIKNQQALIDYYKTICNSETQLLTSCTTVQASSGWLKPVVKGKINSRWGYRNQVLNTGTFHNAHDIGGNAEGTPAYAAAAGTVAAITRRSRCGGNMVYVHVNVLGKAYTMQYAHLLSIKVNVGDKVTTNTVIGLIGGGSTAKSNGGYDSCTTGTHLHFGISKGYYLKDYTSWSKFIANSIEPPGYPKTGVWWYSR